MLTLQSLKVMLVPLNMSISEDFNKKCTTLTNTHCFKARAHSTSLRGLHASDVHNCDASDICDVLRSMISMILSCIVKS